MSLTEILNISFVTAYDSSSKKVTLRGAKYFPKELADYSEHINIVDASDSNLSELPKEFASLNPSIAFFSNNQFQSVPEVLSECSNLFMTAFKSCNLQEIPENSLPNSLKWLIMTHNPLIRKLPKSIARLRKLQKVAFVGLGLEKIPEEIQNWEQVKLLRVSANNLQKPMPSWIWKLPNLAWFSDSGNPISPQVEINGLRKILFSDLMLSEKIGESPSSEVYRAKLNSSEEFAVKLYKNGLTSDGYPIDDMSAYIKSAGHPNLIPIEGVIQEGDKIGLVLKLIPKSHTNLGLPPNFETITRDSFSHKDSFSLEFILNVLRSISGACEHLHNKGISHGISMHIIFLQMNLEILS